MFSFRITVVASMLAAAGTIGVTMQDVPVLITPLRRRMSRQCPDTCAIVTDTQCLRTNQAYMDAARGCALSTLCSISKIDALPGQEVVTCGLQFHTLSAKFLRT